MNIFYAPKNNFFDKTKEWAFIAAAWGDVMCCLSAVNESGIRKILYLGDIDENEITDFLLCQNFIDEIKYISKNSLNLERIEYYNFLSDSIWRNQNFENKLKQILLEQNIDIEFESIFNAYEDWYAQYNKIYQIKNLNLPNYIYDWVENFIEKNSLNKFILVNPFSFQSTDVGNHWSSWGEYIEWLTKYENYNFVFVGHGYEPDFDIEKPNCLNLINKLPSNLHVLGLALRANSIITTSNSLAHWANSHEIICTTMMNYFVSEKYNYFGKILNEKTIYKVWFNDTIDYAKILTNKINFKLYNHQELPQRDLYNEIQLITQNERYIYYLTDKIKNSNSYKMEPVFDSVSFIPYHDFMEDWCIAPDNYDLLLKIARIINPKSFYEIGARNGHGLLTFCYGASDLEKVAWCDNEQYYKHSNYKVTQNLESFNNKYNKNIEYSYIENLEYISEHLIGYQVITIDGEHTYDGKIRDLNIAKSANPEVILVDDYFWESEVRYAIRFWAHQNNLPLHLIHTFRGLVIFDLTSNNKHLQNLINNNIVIDTLDNSIVRFKI